MEKIINILLLLVIIMLIIILFCTNIDNYRDSKPFFIHIPKTGGTSIENIAKKYNIEWGRFYNFKNILKHKITIPECSNWHLPIRYYKDSIKNNFLFTVVRNPYERVISQYKYIKQWDTKMPVSIGDLNKYIKLLKTKNLVGNNMSFEDCHLIPQIEYFKNEDGTIHNIEILRFENLQTDFSNLLRKYNFPNMELPFSNTTKDSVTVSDLNRESLDIINDIYKEDFEFFNYLMI